MFALVGMRSATTSDKNVIQKKKKIKMLTFLKCCQTDIPVAPRHPEEDSIFQTTRCIFLHNAAFSLSATGLHFLPSARVCVTAPVELLQLSLLYWRAAWPVGAAPLPSLWAAGRPRAAPGSATAVKSSAGNTKTSCYNNNKVYINVPFVPGIGLKQDKYLLWDTSRKH